MIMSTLFLELLTLLQLLAGCAPSLNKSHESDQSVEPAMSNDVEGCYVVTIFGLKTADCGKQNARTVPRSLDSDLQVDVH